jgi:hypothetical protein
MWVFEKRRGLAANLVQRSYAGSLLAILVRNVEHGIFGSSAIAVEEFREDSPRWRDIDRSLTEMSALCRAAGIPFVVFHYAENLPALRTLLPQVGAREGFPVLEVFPSGHPRWGARDPLTLVNSAIDAHPNVEGNRMWAELLRDALRGHLDTRERRP